ncbi:hypothetical protein BKA70DRAFT_1408342 [Coprinopsis sp. MPI-PUGE-AT-0042]|nr:hypothetical protein BKA70DRAFT_1408342 [Coprinopsis sp. MPI-PUGE-AT-0042]
MAMTRTELVDLAVFYKGRALFFVLLRGLLSQFRIGRREKAADKRLASIQSGRTESKKALALTLQAPSAQEHMEASTSHSLGNISSHSVQHLEPPETRSSTSQSLRSNDNFHVSLDTSISQNPHQSALATSNEHESIYLPSFRPGPGANLEARVRRRKGSSPVAIQDLAIPAPSYGLSPLGRCRMHGIRRGFKQPVGAQSHRTRNKRQRTELLTLGFGYHDFSGDLQERRLTHFLRFPSPFNSNVEVAAWTRYHPDDVTLALGRSPQYPPQLNLDPG